MSFRTELQELFDRYNVSISEVIAGGDYNAVDFVWSDSDKVDYEFLRVIDAEDQIKIINPITNK